MFFAYYYQPGSNTHVRENNSRTPVGFSTLRHVSVVWYAVRVTSEYHELREADIGPQQGLFPSQTRIFAR